MMFHGAHTTFALHLGICLTDDERAARCYARRGVIASVELDMSGLVVVTVPGYDRNTDTAPGDRDLSDFAGADVIRYEDEDELGRQHDTWRIVTERALSAVTVREVVAA